MRWSPVVVDVAVAVVMWVAVLRLLRGRRARLAADASPRARRSHRLHTTASLVVAVGVTWFFVWLATDGLGPAWLHAASLPVALVFIAGGAAVSGYAGWIGGPA